jgi:hypothetical protein
MKVYEILSELFDPKSGSELEWSTIPGVTYAEGMVDIGEKSVNIDITFSDEGDGKVDLEFMVGGSHNITGSGGAQQVFATVIQAVKKFVTEQPKVNILTFSAYEQSRAKLYNTMANRMARTIGFRVVPLDEIGDDMVPHGGASGYLFVLQRGATNEPVKKAAPFEPVWFVYDIEHKDIEPVKIKSKTGGEAEKQALQMPQFKDSDPFAVFASKSDPRWGRK